MFRNLRTGTKLFILCSMFVIAIAVTMYGLVEEKLIAIEFARKELAGSEYLDAVRGVYSAIATQPLDGELATGPRSTPDDAVAALQSAEASFGDRLQTADSQRELVEALDRLAASEGTARPSTVVDALARAQALAIEIGNNSNLTLDPDLDTYYLQQIAVSALPALLGQLAELEILTRAVGDALPDDRRVRILFAESRLQSNVEDIRSDLVAAYRGNAAGGLEPAVQPAFDTMITSALTYLNEVDPRRERAAEAIAPGSAAYGNAVRSGIAAWEVTQAELNRLLQRRIDGFASRMLSSLLLTGSLAALSILLAVLTYRHIVIPLARFERVARSIRDSGNYDLRVDHDSHDEIGRLAAAFNDLLDKRAADESARRARDVQLAQLAAVVEQSRDFIGVCDPQGNPLFVNQAGLRMVGLPDLEAARAVHFIEYYPERMRETVATNALSQSEKYGYWEAELAFQRFDDGREIPIQYNCFPVRTDDGQIVAYATVSHDLTEQKRSEDALRAMRSELVYLGRVSAMGEVTASIAHELNQPLAAIAANASAGSRWLGREEPDLHEAQEALRRIVGDAERASQIIMNIRTMFKKGEESRTRLDIGLIVQDVLALVRSELDKQNVRVRLAMDKDLPAVSANRVELQQVVLNLIANGIDAMRAVTDRERRLNIEAAVHAPNGISLTVEDSGTGIDPKDMDRIFTSFFTTKPHGMGLGLSICRTIIESYGGRLSASQHEPHGTAFHLVLPVAEASEA